jgi:osmotically-inducible protein OsmY
MNIRNITPLVGALSAAFALAGCNRQEPRQTTGQKVAAAIETSKDKMEDAKQATGDVLKATGTAIGDSAITASVKASLAADTELKMLDISLETTSGRTLLKGSAPNTTARDRATQIAKAVDGVTGVDNLLEVKP